MNGTIETDSSVRSSASVSNPVVRPPSLWQCLQESWSHHQKARKDRKKTLPTSALATPQASRLISTNKTRQTLRISKLQLVPNVLTTLN